MVIVFIERLAKQMNTVNVINQYQALKDKIAQLELELKPLKAELEAVALEHGGTYVIEGYKVQLSEASRESVSLKEAKAVLGIALNPFLKTSFFTQLRVTS